MDQIETESELPVLSLLEPRRGLAPTSHPKRLSRRCWKPPTPPSRKPRSVEQDEGWRSRSQALAAGSNKRNLFPKIFFSIPESLKIRQRIPLSGLHRVCS